MAESYLFAVIRKLGKKIRESFIERKLLMIRKNHNRHCGELLRNRGESEVCICAAGGSSFEVGQAVNLRGKNSALVNHHDTCARRIRPVVLLEQSIQFSDHRVRFTHCTMR